MRSTTAGALLLAAVTLSGCAGQSLEGAAPTVAPTVTPSTSSVVKTSAAGDAPDSPSLAPAPPATTTSTAPTAGCRHREGLIREAVWVQRDGEIALRVVPSTELRSCALSAPPLHGWDEVLALVPDADGPQMEQQYECHLRFASQQETWHLEPWRPLVSDQELILSRCNPAPLP